MITVPQAPGINTPTATAPPHRDGFVNDLIGLSQFLHDHPQIPASHGTVIAASAPSRDLVDQAAAAMGVHAQEAADSYRAIGSFGSIEYIVAAPRRPQTRLEALVEDGCLNPPWWGNDTWGYTSSPEYRDGPWLLTDGRTWVDADGQPVPAPSGPAGPRTFDRDNPPPPDVRTVRDNAGTVLIRLGAPDGNAWTDDVRHGLGAESWAGIAEGRGRLTEVLDAPAGPPQSRIDALIEASSLGTPAAKALRQRTPDEVARRIVARAAELDATDLHDLHPEPGEPPAAPIPAGVEGMALGRRTGGHPVVPARLDEPLGVVVDDPRPDPGKADATPARPIVLIASPIPGDAPARAEIVEDDGGHNVKVIYLHSRTSARVSRRRILGPATADVTIVTAARCGPEDIRIAVVTGLTVALCQAAGVPIQTLGQANSADNAGILVQHVSREISRDPERYKPTAARAGSNLGAALSELRTLAVWLRSHPAYSVQVRG